MKQFPNFDLSIVMLLGDRLDSFIESIPSRVAYYERNGIEVILLVDKEVDCQSLFKCISEYPFICWKVVIGFWHNCSTAYNEGVRQSIKAYILLMSSESVFQTDVIYELRKNLDEYPLHYSIDSSCDCLMVKKEYLDLVGGCDEQIDSWEGSEENLCRRLELAGICQLYFPDALLQHTGKLLYKTCWQGVPSELLSKMLLPVESKVKNHSVKNTGMVIYDWEEHPYAKEQCGKYLSGLKQYEITTNEVFEKSYPLIALIPAYNESERIMDCLRSVEKYCDGIILLDDDSQDDTYEKTQSDKLLLKAKKVRTEFNDKQNRNILLDIASFFKVEWFIFIDADELFDDRFVDLREVIDKPNVDIVGVCIANLWDSLETYRVMQGPYTRNGLWLRWRMFRNKGRMQIISRKKLHFPSIPYGEKKCNFFESKTLLIHLGYLTLKGRQYKYNFYQIEDYDGILSYDDILYDNCEIAYVQEICLIK